MRKAELRQLGRINATHHMIVLANEKGKYTYKSTWGSKIQRSGRCDLLVRCQQQSGILMVSLFLPERVRIGETAPTYEIYCDTERKKYITRILRNGQEEKWTGAMADNLKEIDPIYTTAYSGWYKGMKERVWQDPREEEAIKRILHTQHPGLRGLVEWQHRIKEEKIKEKEAKEKAPWDKDMALVPPLPPSFIRWTLKQSPDSYIFYHYQDGGAKEGYCSHCEHWIPIKVPRHLKECRCPRCGVAATYRASGKISTLRTKEYDVQLVQRCEGGIVVRILEARQWYKGPEDIVRPEYSVNETNRIILPDDGPPRRYYKGIYKNKEHRWIPEQYWGGMRIGRTTLYKKNLTVLQNTKYKNSAAALWACLPLRLDEFLQKELAHPLLEKAIKAGLPRLAYDLATVPSLWTKVDEKETSLTKAIKLDTARFRRLKEMDGGTLHLRWLQSEKTDDTLYPDEMIRSLSEDNIWIDDLLFLPPEQKITKIWRYLEKQKELSKREGRRLLGTWRDYLDMADKAGMDTGNDMILYPKDLYAAHQRMIALIQEGEMEKEARKLAKKWPKVDKTLPALKKFEYTKDGYTIVSPVSILDIVKEGHALQHCVHTCDFYFDRIQKHESYLFFLRRAATPDIPWYTLEVEPSGNIRQKRTTGDNQGKDLEEAVKFLKAWQKYFCKKLTKAEKEQGKKADQARRQEYEKLRADGNRVWHGRLAGQLLADVLEQDFMGVEPQEPGDTDAPLPAQPDPGNTPERKPVAAGA